MSLIHTLLAFCTPRRRPPESSNTIATGNPPARQSTAALPAARPLAQRSRTASGRKTWANPTGAATPDARSSDDGWPRASTHIADVPAARPAHVGQHHCPAPAQHESYSNHDRIHSTACDSDEYNRNSPGGTPDFGTSTDTRSSIDYGLDLKLAQRPVLRQA